MIDLHSHILPGLDDGPADLEGSLEFARAVVASGTRTLVATPHIRDDHRFPLNAIEAAVEELQAALASDEIDLQVLAGGEVAISKVPDLDASSLRSLCLGESSYVLVESPHTHSSGFLESVLAELQAEGLRPLLAHPERSPSFVADLVRLERIVSGGVLCSVTAPSMQGAFGRRVKDFSARLFSDGLVHNVASDSHSATRRPPGLAAAFDALDAELPGLADQQGWFAREVPEAILADRALPTRPSPLTPRRRGWRSLIGGPVGVSVDPPTGTPYGR